MKMILFRSFLLQLLLEGFFDTGQSLVFLLSFCLEFFLFSCFFLRSCALDSCIFLLRFRARLGLLFVVAVRLEEAAVWMFAVAESVLVPTTKAGAVWMFAVPESVFQLSTKAGLMRGIGTTSPVTFFSLNSFRPSTLTAKDPAGGRLARATG